MSGSLVDLYNDLGGRGARFPSIFIELRLAGGEVIAAVTGSSRIGSDTQWIRPDLSDRLEGLVFSTLPPSTSAG